MDANQRAMRDAYKETKLPMGVYTVREKGKGLCFVAAAANLKGGMNGARFKLETGSHPCRPLQVGWNEKGPDAFEFLELERLDYDKDGLRTDYREDLKALRDIWVEKLSHETGRNVMAG